MGKLTWIRYGLMLLAGLAGFACSQEAREPVEVGTAQVELRSNLVLPETPGTSTPLLTEDHPDHRGHSGNSPPTAPRSDLQGREDYSRDRAYRDIQRYEFLPALLKEHESRKGSGQEGPVHENSWTFAKKHWVRSGKGFGVGAGGMVPSGTIQPNDESYYSPTVALKPYSKASEHMEPVTGSFKSRKPLIFHDRATGFAYEPPAEATPTRHSSDFETRLELSPITEPKVSAKPSNHKTQSLDLMNGNENLNRHRFYQRDAGPSLAEIK